MKRIKIIIIIIITVFGNTMTSFNTPIITRSQTSKMATIEEMAQLLKERDSEQIPISTQQLSHYILLLLPFLSSTFHQKGIFACGESGF